MTAFVRDILECMHVSCVRMCRNVPFAVSYPTAGFSCGGLASPSFSSLHRPADSTGSGSGIFSNLSFVQLQNRPFCVLFSAGHCEERFLVSALIHAVTLARMPPTISMLLAGLCIRLLLGELRLHYFSSTLLPITAPKG